MTLNIRRAAFTALAAISFTVLATPLAANAATNTYNIDCDELEDTYTAFYSAPSDTVTLNLTNCATWTEFDNDLNPIANGATGASETFSLGDHFNLKSSTGANGFEFDVFPVKPESVPAGELLLEDRITIPAAPEELTVGAPDGDSGDHWLGGDEQCGLMSGNAAKHVYSTMDITILTDGTYTFRGISADPEGVYMPLGAYHPLSDGFLAVYSNFDPATPDAGVVGCNDDLNDQLGYDNEEFVEQLSGGAWMEGHQPYFTADLAAGHYTLVLLTWESFSAAQWAADWGYPSTMTFEMWGPTDGLVKGHVDLEELADTGVELDVAPFAAAAFLISVGGFIAFSRKRRTN
ncbi:hypothetical protein [Rhodoluna sp.]|uniref:hypothetical protein n=1 Tax=Rhodoluna sp. TaxID=1969481 RepID=UPI0025EDFDFA|nr:hypothetical protein [Rhodoluna sp.]